MSKLSWPKKGTKVSKNQSFNVAQQAANVRFQADGTESDFFFFQPDGKRLGPFASIDEARFKGNEAWKELNGITAKSSKGLYTSEAKH